MRRWAEWSRVAEILSERALRRKAEAQARMRQNMQRGGGTTSRRHSQGRSRG